MYSTITSFVLYAIVAVASTSREDRPAARPQLQVYVSPGGRPIKAWQPDAGGRWKARTCVENFRQLYVDGRRATRARGGPPGDIQLFGKDGFKTSDVAIAGWRNPSDIELCFYVMWGPLKAWTHTRCKVESIHREGSE
jgi:hypothetical protein